MASVVDNDDDSLSALAEARQALEQCRSSLEEIEDSIEGSKEDELGEEMVQVRESRKRKR